MRIYQKKQLLELVNSIHEAHTMIREKIENQSYTVLIEVLTKCQETAIQIGTIIEQVEGDGLKVISYLEEYCEFLYQISVAIEDIGANKILEILKQQLAKIEKAIKNEIQVTYEMVFLPYKASMWDSLESIWMAAEEDSACKCYVIAIPYFDRTAEGKFGEMHYEGDLMPDYVPITDYKQYDLFARRPDVIYFHNPYDQYNFATSVHPAFYSLELKKHTDKLVYVPYFVSEGDVPEHLCGAIGIFNADYVIVQSEKEKEIYSRVFMRMLGKKQKEIESRTGRKDGHYWKMLKDMADKKFLPLGSPKFDKVTSTNREDVILPEDWKKIIYEKDEKRKQVIFYNTTIEALISNKDKMLDKIKNTLKIFEVNKEVVLLWRPHPLSEATLSSMRPELLMKYKNIVNQYKHAGWGIYDDTSDLNRAIAISDAYYGDWSSVVALYKNTGKPLMIQNVEVLSE